jgi:ABC-type proline/glycine betaine transport system permease subunit
MEGARNKSGYDVYSAITFLMVGLGIGSVLAIVFSPKQRVVLERINRSRMTGLEARSKEEDARVA